MNPRILPIKWISKFMKRIDNLPRNLNGKNNGHWKGGIHKRIDGYELVRKGIVPAKTKGARYILKHRLVMEEYLRRPLLKSEIVHHKNGNRSDNRIQNLEIMSQAKHAKLHYKVDRKTGRFLQKK